jgi:glutamyl-tRNA synthetase
MNGVYIRELPVEEFAQRLVRYLREQGYDWDEELVQRAAPIVQEKITTLGAFPGFAGFLFQEIEPDPTLLDGQLLELAAEALEQVEPFTADGIEQALRALVEKLGLTPHKAFQPIRVAVTGSKVSPGLFESLELLGKERSLTRIRGSGD